MLVDTNILVHALNKDSSKNKQAINFLKDNEGKLTVAHQNIIESIKVLTQPKFSNPLNPKLAIKAVLAITEACRIVVPKFGTELIALEFIKEFNLTGNRIFDAYLTATALSNGIDIIATDNTSDFQKFKQIKILNPFL